jgi:hypothetical protein
MAATGEAGNPKAPTGKGSGPKSSSATSKSSSASSKSVPQPDLLTVTIQTRTGQIVKIESVDDTGARHELSDEEKASLAKERGEVTLETVLEQAFEAGIASVLGDEASDEPQGFGDESPESEEDADLRRMLLRPLIERSAAKRLMRRDVLSRVILETLIQHAASRVPERESSSAKQGPRGRHH